MELDDPTVCPENPVPDIFHSLRHPLLAWHWEMDTTNHTSIKSRQNDHGIQTEEVGS